MGNCVSSCRRQHPKKAVTLALVGIDDAGKTTASFCFAGEPVDQDVAPTIGFRNVKFSFGTYDISLFDVGGGKGIRDVWKNYFPEVYGLIYMVDSSSADRMEEARDVLRETLEHPCVSGKPILLLANKQDKPDALDEVDICELLNLESVVNANKCPCHIHPCSAIRADRKLDPHMKQGLVWLLATVERQWEELQARVAADTKVAEERERQEAAERRERVRKQREEREKQEEEERERLGLEKPVSDEEGDLGHGDPFKRLDLAELTKKDETLKAEKKKKKEMLASLTTQEQPASDQLRERLTDPSFLDNNQNSDRFFAPRALPPLEPLGTPFLEEGTPDRRTKKKKKKRTPRNTTSETIRQSKDRTTTDDDGDVVTGTLTSVIKDQLSVRTASNIMVSTHDDFPAREMLAAGITRIPLPPDGGDNEENADTPRTRKVKKKKLRQLGARLNGQVRTGEGDGREEGAVSLQSLPQHQILDGGDLAEDLQQAREEKRFVKPKRSAVEGVKYELTHSEAGKGRENGAVKAPVRAAPRLSRNSQMHSNISIESDHLGVQSWGLAEDLTAVADDSIAFRQPNFGGDENLVL